MTHWLLTYPQLRLFLDGMLAMMAVYALLTFWQQRKAIYWQYALYISCMVCTFWLNDQHYDTPKHYPGSHYDTVLLESLAFLLYIRFGTLMMDIRQNDRLSYRILQGIQVLMVGHLGLEALLLLGNVSVVVQSMLYTLVRYTMAGLGLYVVWRIIRLRQTIITYFVVGSFCFVIGCCVALAADFLSAIFVRDSSQPLTFSVTYLEIGVVLEVLCFTLGIATRSRQIEQAQLAMQARLIEQLQENDRKQQEIQRIRADIARDLHDDVGGDLSSISMLSQAADRNLASRPEEARALLQLIGESSRQVLTNMRRIVWSLRTPAEPNTALLPDPRNCRLREAALALFEHQPVQPDLDLPDPSDLAQLPDDVCRELYLLYKELLHNVVRHAFARHVSVSLKLTSRHLRLRVVDDGVGFEPANVPPDSNGLASLRQRALDLGGRLHIESVLGEGTTCVFTMPIQRTRRVPGPQRTEKAA